MATKKRPRDQISARLDPEIADIVHRVAAVERRPVSNVVRNVLTDWARARAAEIASEQAAWSAAGADLILGGHIHLPFVRNLQEANPHLRRRLWAVQAGTALSRRVRDGVPNSVNLIRWVAPVCAIERWDFDDRTQAFVPVAHDELVVDRG